MEKNSYTAKKNEDGSYSLLRNGIVCLCPKTAYPIPMQSRLGDLQMHVTRFSCATNCPFASIEDAGANESRYEIKCEGSNLRLKLDEIIEDKKPILSPK